MVSVGTPFTNLDARRLLADGRGLRRLARRILKDATRADDAVQDAWLVALDKAGGEPSEPWLRGVVRNTARNAARGDRRRGTHEARVPSGPGPKSPADLAEQMEEHRALVEALTELPEPYRTTLWMRYFAGRSPSSIAKHFEVPAATVRVRCKRALALLRQRLDSRHDGDRRGWMAALVPLSGVGGLRTGVLWSMLMTAKTKLVAAGVLVLVLLTAGVLVWLPDDQGEQPDADTELVAEGEQRPELAPLEAGGATEDEPIDDEVDDSASDEVEGDRTPEPQNEPEDGVPLGGRVFGADGKPLSEVTVYLVPKDTSKRGPRFDPVRVETTKDGRWKFVAPRDYRDYWFAAAPKSHAGLLHAFVDGASVVPDTPVEFRLKAAFERTFIVESVSGRDLEQLRIGAIPRDVDKIVTWPGPGEPTMGSWGVGLGDDRRWTVKLPYDGPIRVSVAAHRFATEVFVVDEGDRRPEIRVALRDSSIVRIRVKGFEPETGWINATLHVVGGPLDGHQFGSAGMRDGIIEFRSRVGPGTYRAKLYSQVIETKFIEPIVVEGYGQTVELETSVTRKTDIGELTIRVPASRERTQHPWYLIRRKADGDWTAAYFFATRESELLWRFLDAGRYDIVIANEQMNLCAALRGVRVLPGEVTKLSPVFGRAVSKRMPKLALVLDEIARADVLGPDGGTLPLYSARGQSWGVSAMPSAGTKLGPFPEGVRTLRLTLKNGKTEDVELDDAQK